MRQATTIFVDDLDGTAATETVHFMRDGVEYEIDLNDEHAADLREVYRQYIMHGRRVGGRAIRRQLSTDTASTTLSHAELRKRAQSIREWATANGVPVSPRGRLSVELVAQYEEAQRAAAEPPPKRRKAPASLARPTRRRAARTVTVRGK